MLQEKRGEGVNDEITEEIRKYFKPNENGNITFKKKINETKSCIFGKINMHTHTHTHTLSLSIHLSMDIKVASMSWLL